jgi:hypothetical protein
MRSLAGWLAGVGADRNRYSPVMLPDSLLFFNFSFSCGQRPIHEEESLGKDRGTDENCCNRDQRRRRDGHESDRGRGERSYRSYRHRDEDSERGGDRGDRDRYPSAFFFLLSL